MNHVPVRTCCSCKQKKEKKKLLRFVYHNNEMLKDDKQNFNGRGAYCCDRDQCIDRLLNNRKKWKRWFRL